MPCNPDQKGGLRFFLFPSFSDSCYLNWICYISKKTKKKNTHTSSLAKVSSIINSRTRFQYRQILTLREMPLLPLSLSRKNGHSSHFWVLSVAALPPMNGRTCGPSSQPFGHLLLAVLWHLATHLVFICYQKRKNWQVMAANLGSLPAK